MAKADLLSYAFKNKNTLNIRQYLTKKHGLYIKAGKASQDLIIRRLYDKLDPYLASAVTLRLDGKNRINKFTTKVYAAKN